MTARRWVVVGAGSAGCVVASTLGSSPGADVLLLEAGADRTAVNRPSAISSPNWRGVFGDSSLWWPELTAVRQPHRPPAPYLRGLGVGGSAAVNGLLALPGLPADWDRWATKHGCRGWSWDDIADDAAALRDMCWRASARWPDSLDEALFGAATELDLPTGIDPWYPGDGAGAAWLTATPTARYSSAEAWLDLARMRGEVRVRADTSVDHVLVKRDRAVGVVLTSGEVVRADGVVLCAGALGSPAILLRSGFNHHSLGRHLQDHPSVRVDLRRRRGVPRPDRAPIQSLLRVSSSVGASDLHVLPVDMGGKEVALLVGLMATEGRGRLTLGADPLGPPRVETGEVSTDRDRRAMVDARMWLERLVQTEALTSSFQVEGAIREVNDLFHAAGTCRMGPATDPESVVNIDGRVLATEGLWVADASVFPELPTAGPHIPTVLVAGRLARRACTS